MVNFDEAYSTWSVWFRYAVALALFLIGLSLRFTILSGQHGPAFVTFYPAIIIGFYLCGTGPGVLLVFLSGIAGEYFFIDPIQAFPADLKSYSPLMFFALTSFLVGFFIKRLHNNAELHDALSLNLSASEERFRRVSTIISDLIYSCHRDEDGQFHVDWLSGNAEKVFGYSNEEIIKAGGWRSAVLQQDLPIFQSQITDLLPGRTSQCDLRILDQAGRIHHIHSVVTVIDRLGQHILFGALQDVTDQKELEKKILMREFSLDHANEEVFWIDQSARIFDVNETACQTLGYSRSELQRLNVGDIDPIFPVDKWHEHWRELKQKGSLRFESLHKTRDGKTFPVEIVANHFFYNDMEYNCAFVRDITQLKNLENDLRKQAQTDYLTGVSNRGYFMAQTEQELSRAIRYGNPLSLFMLDIDFFKQINDSHGHKIGDAVLRELTELTRQTLREVDVIGRIGGEEFAILLPETGNEEALEAAERLKNVIANKKIPLEGGLPLKFTVSIGVASLVSRTDNVDVLLDMADQALYEAKNSGRNKVCVFCMH